MKSFFLSLLALQTVCMIFDEFYFHWKRNLPKWERWGHPVDTVFFLIPLGILSFAPKSEAWQMAYLGSSLLSCVITTKDEAIHQKLATVAEQWLHSLLFLLHPAVLFSAFLLWQATAMSFLWIFLAVLFFGLYQLLFWNHYADRILSSRLGNY